MAAEPDLDTLPSGDAQPPPVASGTVERPAPSEASTPSVQSLPAPPPPIAETAQPDGGDVEARNPLTTAKHVQDDIEKRHTFGTWSGVFGGAVILIVLGWTALHAGEGLKDIREAARDDKLSAAVERTVWISIGAHTLVAIAGVFFGYQLIRLAERMFVPRRLLEDVRQLEVVKALVGVDTPVKAAADGMKDIAENLAAVAKPLVDVLKPIVELLARIADKKDK